MTDTFVERAITAFYRRTHTQASLAASSRKGNVITLRNTHGILARYKVTPIGVRFDR